MPTPDKLVDVTFSPDAAASFFVARYQSMPGELYRTADGKRIATLVPTPDKLVDVTFSPDAAASFFVARYEHKPADEASAELRRSVDGAVIAKLGLGVIGATFSPDPAATYVVVGSDFGARLLRSADGTIIASLEHKVGQVEFSPDPAATFFVVTYELPNPQPGEIRRTTDGTIVPVEGGIFRVFFSSKPDRLDFVILYDNGRSALWEWQGALRRLAELVIVRDEPIFDQQGERMIIRAVSRQAYLVDIAWLRAMQGKPEALAADDLAQFACQGPLAGRLWTTDDQNTFAEALGGQPPQVCQ